MNTKNNLHTFVILAYQESTFLESCIKSVIDQTKPSNIIIATTTKNTHITSLAKKYKLDIIEGKHISIGYDFDFAIRCSKTPLVTIAHQDDIYDKKYTELIIDSYKKHPDSSIIFTDYFEIRNNKRIYKNANLIIKWLLLTPIHIKKSLKSKVSKRLILRFGCSICCPSVAFVIKNCPTKIFTSDFKSNVDWHAWEKLSKRPGAFTFVPKKLTGHRISNESATTNTIQYGIRIKEDYEMFKRFWPIPIAKALTKLYKRSEKSNSL